MKIILNEKFNNILKKVVNKYVTHLIYESLLNRELNDNDVLTINKLCEIINYEFLQEGLESDFEPNQYGIDLEDLLDKINKFNLLK